MFVYWRQGPREQISSETANGGIDHAFERQEIGFESGGVSGRLSSRAVSDQPPGSARTSNTQDPLLSITHVALCVLSARRRSIRPLFDNRREHTHDSCSVTLAHPIGCFIFPICAIRAPYEGGRAEGAARKPPPQPPSVIIVSAARATLFTYSMMNE